MVHLAVPRMADPESEQEAPRRDRCRGLEPYNTGPMGTARMSYHPTGDEKLVRGMASNTIRLAFLTDQAGLAGARMDEGRVRKLSSEIGWKPDGSLEGEEESTGARGAGGR